MTEVATAEGLAIPGGLAVAVGAAVGAWWWPRVASGLGSPLRPKPALVSSFSNRGLPMSEPMEISS